MSINRKQLFALIAVSVLFWVIIQGLLNFLPIYALRLGADPASIGNYLGFAFFALAVGGILSGWLSDKFQYRKLWLMGSIILNIPTIWLMSQVTSFPQLVMVTGAVFFLMSITLTLITSLAGLSAGEAERGKIFGILGSTGPVGAVVAGSISGVIINRWGFPTFFLGGVLCAIFALFVATQVEDQTVPQSAPGELSESTQSTLTGSFYLMLSANLIAFACGFVALLGRPLQMDSLGFDPEAISAVVAISGALSIPLPFILGWLSDRINRYYVVALCFLVGAIGLFALAGSNLLWHFAIAAGLLVGPGASLGISQAIVTDIVPPKSRGFALSLYGGAIQIGGVIGFTGAGHAIQAFGMTTTYIAGAVLTIIAILLLYAIQSMQRRQLRMA